MYYFCSMKDKLKTIVQWGTIIVLFIPLTTKIPNFIERIQKYFIDNKEKIINEAWNFYYLFIVMFIIIFIIAPCIHITNSSKEDKEKEL